MGGRRGRLAGLVLLLLAVPAGEAAARGDLRALEREFRQAIERVTPATVICAPRDAPGDRGKLSSGVIVTRSGLVLTEGEVGETAAAEGGGGPGLSDAIEVRVPDLETGGFATYRASVVRRIRDVDSTLLRIDDPPPGGFPGHLVPSTSRDLDVGDFVFAMGNAFGLSNEAPPTLTAGVVSSLAPLPAGDAGGAWAAIYTSAAVNPGVDGGPLVDVEGRLVGTVSTALPPIPDEPHQYLGMVVPMDRLRAAYADLPEAADVFPPVGPLVRRAKNALALERVFRAAARHARPVVVSLEVQRRQPLSTAAPGRGGVFPVPRYLGPFSGLVADPSGLVVTSLYQLTNVATLVHPGWGAPPEAEVETGIRAIEAVTVHLADGTHAPARVLAYDGRLGIALLQMDLTARTGGGTGAAPLTPLEAVPDDELLEGRMVLALGNPYGASPHPMPLLAMGILSKHHAEDAPSPWRGDWQTDASATDATCGGAVVDLRGHLVGMMQIWSPTQHGRNSGIGFVVPWSAIERALPALREGRSLRRGQLGIRFREGATRAFVALVAPGSAAERAGLRVGDVIVEVGGAETPTIPEVVGRLGIGWEGDRVRLVVERGGQRVPIEATLGPREPEGG